MAETIVKSTTNVGHAIKYASGSNQGWSKSFQDTPHVSNKYVKNRVMSRWGNNVSSNPHDFYKAVKANHARLNLHKNNVGLIKLTLSSDPKQIDYRSPADRRKWNLVCHEICKDLAPYNMSVGYGQADNHNHVYHMHCLIDPRNLITGKSITHRMLMNKVTPVVDRVEKKFGIKPQRTRTLYTKSGRSYQAPMPTRNVKKRSEYVRYNKGQYDWKDDLKGKISEAVSGSTTFQQFNKKLEAQYVYLYKPYRMSKGHIRLYNGKPKLKKHFTFIMKPPKEYDKEFGIKTDGKGFVKARHKSLGTAFDKSNIFHQLNVNKINISHNRSVKSSGIAPKLSSKAKNNSHHIAKPKSVIHSYKTPKATFYSRKSHIYIKDQGQLFKIGHVDKSTTNKLYHPSGDKRFTKPYSKAPNHLVAMMYDCSKTKHFNLPTFTRCNRQFKPVSKPFLPHAPHLMILNASLNQNTIQLKNDRSMEAYMENMGKYDAQLAQYQANKDTNADIRNEDLAKAKEIKRNNYSRQ